MNFDLSDEQESLRESVRTVLSRECPISLAREVIENGTPADALWRACVELGWTALTIPEACGGLGLGAAELVLVAEEFGRALVPGPLFPTLTQFVPFVREGGTPDQQKEFLEPVARGELTGTLASEGEVQGCRVRSGYRLSGKLRFVMGGDSVDEIGLYAPVEGTDAWGAFVVPRILLNPVATKTLDGTRSLVEISLDDVVVEESRLLAGGQPYGLSRPIEEASLALAADAVGACNALFDRTLAYAKEREQFGQPIGAFQALQHRFADMFIAIEKARSCCAFAAMTLDENDDRRTLAVSMAKAAAGDCQRFVGQQGIQLHGGIGYTWESDVHLFVKRAQTDDGLLGNAAHHRARVADALAL